MKKRFILSAIKNILLYLLFDIGETKNYTGFASL
jgi:hypothetical protein